jgi:DNA-binding MarR family transcriptional regulator
LPAILGEQLQRDSGLSFVEYYVLAGLSDQPDHTIRMSNLAALANSELSRLSHLVRRLEGRGLVRREPDPSDGRFTHAILTPEGFAHLKEAAPGHVAQVRDAVFDVLGPEQQSPPVGLPAGTNCVLAWETGHMPARNQRHRSQHPSATPFRPSVADGRREAGQTSAAH